MVVVLVVVHVITSPSGPTSVVVVVVVVVVVWLGGGAGVGGMPGPASPGAPGGGGALALPLPLLAPPGLGGPCPGAEARGGGPLRGRGERDRGRRGGMAVPGTTCEQMARGCCCGCTRVNCQGRNAYGQHLHSRCRQGPTPARVLGQNDTSQTSNSQHSTPQMARGYYVRTSASKSIKK